MDDSELRETFLRQAKCLTPFRPSLYSEFKFRRGWPWVSFFRGSLTNREIGVLVLNQHPLWTLGPVVIDLSLHSPRIAGLVPKWEINIHESNMLIRQFIGWLVGRLVAGFTYWSTGYLRFDWSLAFFGRVVTWWFDYIDGWISHWSFIFNGSQPFFKTTGLFTLMDSHSHSIT